MLTPHKRQDSSRSFQGTERLPGVHGEPSGPEEAIPGEAALRAYTLDAARAAGFDADRGSLAPGKRADFLVLSDDPLQCPSEAIKDVQVLQTWVAGVPILVRP